MATPAPAPAPAPVDPNKAIRIARFFSYPKQELYLLASFLFLISLVHYFSLAQRYLSRRRLSPTRSISDGPGKVRLTRLPAAVMDSLRAVAFRLTVPLGFGYTLNLAEMGLTAGYIGVLFTWTFVNTTNLQGMLTDPKYYANRAGTIAMSQLPIMAALGMRNNLISYLTGVSFDKLNYFHRLSARVICVLAWVHAGGRITVGLTDDETPDHRWVRCGPLAASALTLLCILSIRPARERAYELFLFIHLIFALIFMLAVLFHLTGRTKTYYGAWPAFIVWGIDRFIRVIQLLLYNRGYFLPSSSTRTTEALDAQITLLTPHFLRINLRRPSLHWRAGQSAFLSFPTLPGGWALESHPFTIATLPSGSNGDKEKELVFILRVRKGLTHRLALAAASPQPSPGALGLQRVFISGPYSSPPLMIGYQRIVLVAGGSGAAFTVPLLLDVIRRAQANESACQHVLFVWAIRDIDHLSWIQDILSPTLLSALPASLGIQLLFYITSASETDSEESSISGDGDDVEKWAEASDSTPSPVLSHSPSVAGEAGASAVVESANEKGVKSTAVHKITDKAPKATLALLAQPFVRVQRGRPDIDTLLNAEIAQATGRVSVNVCGTHGLAETVRRALRTPRPMDVLRGGATVTLHVEAFGGN